MPDESHSISAAAVRAHVVALADDALEGRGAGYPGEEKAAAYIAERFRAIGLATTLQEFTFLPRAPEHVGESLTSRNVLAVLPGADPAVANEVVVVGAHHDGQGRPGQADGGRFPAADEAARSDTIWNSADDNASSVAAILEIARALANDSARPRRTIVFATFGAEEHALNGSAHLALNPWPGGSRCVAMINLEKIGRVPRQPLVMVGCATSSDWVRVLGEANAQHAQHVECVIPDLVPDTDHYPFGALGVPAVVFGTMHEEDSHQPTDESSRLDFDALAGRAAFVRGVVAIAANRERCLAFESATERGLGLLAVTASETERTELALNADSALKVSVVLPGLPAARAGLRVGDFVTAIDGKALPARLNERELHDALVKTRSIELTVHRAGVESSVRVDS